MAPGANANYDHPELVEAATSFVFDASVASSVRFSQSTAAVPAFAHVGMFSALAVGLVGGVPLLATAANR